MNKHTWNGGNECAKCGCLRSQDKVNDIRITRYSTDNGQTWVEKRPSCTLLINGIPTAVLEIKFPNP